MLLIVLSMNFTAPSAPSQAELYLPEDTENFADGLLHILKTALSQISPDLTNAAQICLSLVAIVLLISLLRSFSGVTKTTTQLVGTLLVSILLVKSSQTLISLGVETIQTMSEYGKLLLPVMAAALAAQGGTASSTALYAGTAVFNTLLTSVLSNIMIPAVYIFIAVCIANSVMKQEMLTNIVKFIKWVMTWTMKIILYVFTGYISITGVISGTVDAAALKATKITISGAVPIVGSIISDASETILISAGLVKNSVGIYGLFVILSLWIGPFLRIAVQYLLLKLTGAVCSVFGKHSTLDLIHDFTAVMGFLLAATGIMCLLLLITTVCFMRGVSV